MSNFSKFRVGDKVQTQLGSKGTIKGIGNKGDIFDYRVVLGDSMVETTYEESDLKFDSEFLAETGTYHIGTMCPVCSTKWTVTKFGAKEWKDCSKCNKTAEDLCKYNKPNHNRYYGVVSDDDYDMDFGYADIQDYLAKYKV